MSTKILIVTRDQFGYHVDPYAYARELTRHFEVTYFCWDYGRPRVSAPGVEVIYSSRGGSLPRRNLRFLRELRAILPDYELTLLFYFTGASLLLSPGAARANDRLICDVRTGCVKGSRSKRWLSDALLKLEMKAFRHRSFISESLGRSFGFTDFNVLPLGAAATTDGARDYEALRLLYVGTLENRQLEDTIVGLGLFRKQHGRGAVANYTIVGSGSEAEVENVQSAVRQHELGDVVELTGYIQRDRVGPYLSQANVGVSYVPITDFYNFQPVTKTYEYFLAGLPVIATATYEHTLIVEPHNGVLTQSNPESFAEGLTEVYQRRHTYAADDIRQRAARFSYRHIVDTYLLGYLRGLMTSGPIPQNSQSSSP
jgi:glycosyltransferase involved in cell wall biosynthesis